MPSEKNPGFGQAPASCPKCPLVLTSMYAMVVAHKGQMPDILDTPCSCGIIYRLQWVPRDKSIIEGTGPVVRRYEGGKLVEER